MTRSPLGLATTIRARLSGIPGASLANLSGDRDGGDFLGLEDGSVFNASVDGRPVSQSGGLEDEGARVVDRCLGKVFAIGFDHLHRHH